MNSMEIVNAAVERYNAKFQEMKVKEAELNRYVRDFKKFWQQVLKENMLRYCDYVEDIGLVAKEREYTFEGGKYFSTIEVEQFIDQREDISAKVESAIKQSFSDFCVDLTSGLSSDSPKGEAVAGAVAGLAVGIAVNFTVGKAMAWWEDKKQEPRAREYEKEVDIAIEKMDQTFVLYETYIRNVNEVWDNIKKIAKHTKNILDNLEPLVPDFRDDEEHKYYKDILKQSRTLIEKLGELMQIRLINDSGDIAPECYRVFKQISTITNMR